MSSDWIPEKQTNKRTPKHRGQERGQEKIQKTRNKAACLHETGGKGEILRSRCMPLAGTLGKTSVNRASQTHLSAWLQDKVHFFAALWKLFFPVFRTPPEYWTLGAARPASGLSRRALSQWLKQKILMVALSTHCWIYCLRIHVRMLPGPPPPPRPSTAAIQMPCWIFQWGLLLCPPRGRQISRHKTLT